METHNQKRTDYISWDEYFMGVAILSGMRSKDPNSQVGACIVSSDNKILSMGYNGFPMGCSDDEFPWAREGEALDTKYLYVTHSELNAILNYRGGSLEGAKRYVSLFPCNECAKAIIQIQPDGKRDFFFCLRKPDRKGCEKRNFRILFQDLKIFSAEGLTLPEISYRLKFKSVFQADALKNNRKKSCEENST